MPTYDPFEEGDALTAANINSRFTTLRTWVNAITASSVARWALRREHLPSQTFGPSQTVELFPLGFQASAPARDGGSTHALEYDNSLPYAVGPAHPVNYQKFSTSGAQAPYGEVAGDSGGGWRIPAQALSATPMEVDFSTAITSMATYGFRGLLVRAQAEIYTAAGGRTVAGVVASERANSRCALIGIGFEDNSGGRYVIQRTVRWSQIRGIARGTISTSTMLKDADLAAGDGTVKKVFGVVASQEWADTMFTNDPPFGWSLYIRHYNISILPIRGDGAV